jgi:hypothetical protein
MSDISISFPPWMIAWLLLGEATPLITLVLIGLAAAFFFSRNTGRIRRAYWLKVTLAIVGGLWVGGISFWAATLCRRAECANASYASSVWHSSPLILAKFRLRERRRRLSCETCDPFCEG